MKFKPKEKIEYDYDCENCLAIDCRDCPNKKEEEKTDEKLSSEIHE